MPAALVKALAKKNKVSSTRVERYWDEADEIIKKNYPKVKKDSKRYYQLKNAITSKRAGYAGQRESYAQRVTRLLGAWLP